MSETKGVTYIMVDVETDGPVPGLYSMIQIGAIVVDQKLDKTFYGELRPLDLDITEPYIQEALNVVGVTREQTLKYPHATYTMDKFVAWVKEVSGNTRPILISDNNGFDYMFTAWYCHMFAGENPFGHTSQNLGSLYKGAERSMYKTFKKLRITPHTHNPVDDARGNAEAMLNFGRFIAGLLPKND